MSSARTYFELCNKPVFNRAGETIPGFAVMQVIEWTEFEENGLFAVKKPDGAGKFYVVNGPFPILADRPGIGTRHDGAWALYDPTLTVLDDEPKELGPIDGQWYLGESGSGFVTIGGSGGVGASEPGFPPSSATKRIRIAIPGGSGVGGPTLVRGWLVKTIPAESIVDEAVILRVWNGPWYGHPKDVDGFDVVTKMSGINMGFDDIRGSEELKVSVFGQKLSGVEFIDGEEVAKTYFEIWNVLDHAMTNGMILSPPNGRPQGPSHQSGIRKFTLDGGPCEPFA